MRPAVYHHPPPGYREVEYLRLLEPSKYLALNLAALLPLAVAILVFDRWWAAVVNWRGVKSGGFGADWPGFLWLILFVVASIPLHEWLHGLAIRWAGHQPRYGVMWRKAAFYATADNALFPRNAYIVIALAPIVGVTLLGMALLVLLPDAFAYPVSLAAALNAANSIGDLWMAAALVRHPAHVLVRDEMDGFRVYAPSRQSLR